ncbi:MAG: Rpn family recombination-promoting nuclease/putative transposase [Cyanobacteria bacterium J06649_4]
MRRDSIFYYLFRRAPTLLSELVPEPPANADEYRFDSVAVKEPKFEIDGVFLPPKGKPGAVFFVEVQFQKDERLYERIFAEASLYFYRSRESFTDWQVLVIYPSRSTEQSDIFPHRSFLNGGQVHRIYLDELGDIQALPLWVALMVLTTVEKDQAPERAKELLSRAQAIPTTESRVIIDMVVTIVSYRFDQITRQEVEKMLDITFEGTRVFQEVKEDAMREGRQKGLQEGLQEGRKEGLQEGRREGRREEAASLIIRLFDKRFRDLPEDMRTSISELPLAVLEGLSETLLDFSDVSEVQEWLADHTN